MSPPGPNPVIRRGEIPQRSSLLVHRVCYPFGRPLVRWQFQGGLAEDQRRAFLFTNVTDAAGRRYDIPVAVGHRYSVGTAQANAKPSGHQLAPDAIFHVSSQALCSLRNLARPGCTAICGFALMPCTCRPTKSLAMTEKPGSIFSSSSLLS
jgi:hypothetical protein